MLKKYKKVILYTIIIIIVLVTGTLIFFLRNLLNYNEIEFICTQAGDSVSYEFISKEGRDVNLNSFSLENYRDSEGRVIKSKSYIFVGGTTNLSEKENRNYFNEIMSSEESIIEWIFVFKDRTITVINGKIQK